MLISTLLLSSIWNELRFVKTTIELNIDASRFSLQQFWIGSELSF